MVEPLLSIYIELIAKLLRGLRVSLGPSGVSISFQQEAEHSLDERIAKLDGARQNLIDGISAIDRLKADAERNRAEVATAAQQIERLNQDKQALTAELNAMKSILTADVDAFRRVAGVPTAADIRRERTIGFVSGVVASVIASGIVWAVAKLIRYFS